MISLNKCTGICKVLSPKICVPKETKDINVKAFNMITNKDEAKAMTEHISCYCKCKFNSTTCNSNQEWNNKPRQCESKNYRKCKKDHCWHPSTSICENSKYLKSVADTSVTECDEIIIVIDNGSTKETNTIATKKTNIASINCHGKKSKRFLYFACSFSSDHITIDNYYYFMLLLYKTKRCNIKWKIMNLEKFVLKIIRAIILMT